MFAKNLEIVLAYLCEKGDVSHSLPQEFGARFEALRRYGELPRGRERRDQLLTSSQIASAILSLATVHPNWAGHAARILSGLRPIGGVDACFFGTSTLQESIACILTDATARNSVIRLSVSAAEAAINSNGYATLSYEIGGTRRRTFYGRAEAPSLMQPGAERDFATNSLTRRYPERRLSVERFSCAWLKRCRAQTRSQRPQGMDRNTMPKKPNRRGTESLVHAGVRAT